MCADCGDVRRKLSGTKIFGKTNAVNSGIGISQAQGLHIRAPSIPGDRAGGKHVPVSSLQHLLVPQKTNFNLECSLGQERVKPRIAFRS